jgi:hypothetical protein
VTGSVADFLQKNSAQRRCMFQAITQIPVGLLYCSSMHWVEYQTEPDLSQQWFKYFAAINSLSLEEAVMDEIFTFNYHLQSQLYPVPCNSKKLNLSFT